MARNRNGKLKRNEQGEPAPKKNQDGPEEVKSLTNKQEKNQENNQENVNKTKQGGPAWHPSPMNNMGLTVVADKRIVNSQLYDLLLIGYPKVCIVPTINVRY